MSRLRVRHFNDVVQQVKAARGLRSDPWEGRGFGMPSAMISAPIPYLLRFRLMTCSFHYHTIPSSSSLMSNWNWLLLILHPLLNDIFPLLPQVPCIIHTKAMLEDFSNLL